MIVPCDQWHNHVQTIYAMALCISHDHAQTLCAMMTLCVGHNHAHAMCHEVKQWLYHVICHDHAHAICQDAICRGGSMIWKKRGRRVFGGTNSQDFFSYLSKFWGLFKEFAPLPPSRSAPDMPGRWAMILLTYLDYVTYLLSCVIVTLASIQSTMFLSLFVHPSLLYPETQLGRGKWKWFIFV